MQQQKSKISTNEIPHMSKRTKTVPTARGIHTEIGKKYGITGEAVRASLAQGSTKYADDYIAIANERLEKYNQYKAAQAQLAGVGHEK